MSEMLQIEHFHIFLFLFFRCCTRSSDGVDSKSYKCRSTGSRSRWRHLILNIRVKRESKIMDGGFSMLDNIINAMFVGSISKKTISICEHKQ